MSRFQPVALTESQSANIARARQLFEDLEELLNFYKASREKSIAITDLEAASFRVVRAISVGVPE